MIEFAQNEEISIICNDDFMHALMDTAGVMEYIPKNLILAAADILCLGNDIKDKQSQNNKICV
jgi:flagellar biosynthesis protein FlhB